MLKKQNKRRATGAAITAVLAAFGLIAYLNVGTASADEPTCAPLTGFEQPYCAVDAGPPAEGDLRPALETQEDGAIFWTGRVDGESVEQRAADFAADNGGSTLELALSRAGIVMPVFADRTPEAVEAWELASQLFAEQASGTAFVVKGTQVRDGNVFETKELPALLENPGVRELREVDARTGEQVVKAFTKIVLSDDDCAFLSDLIRPPGDSVVAIEGCNGDSRGKEVAFRCKEFSEEVRKVKEEQGEEFVFAFGPCQF
jgi:hypothetical protein